MMILVIPGNINKTLTLMSSFTDGEVPHSAAARSLVKRQWQTARRRHDEDDGDSDEDDGRDDTSQNIENTGNTL